jgi:hypothetical protein
MVSNIHLVESLTITFMPMTGEINDREGDRRDDAKRPAAMVILVSVGAR